MGAKTQAKSNKIHHVTGLYLEGIRDGRVLEALDAHTGDRYTQHSTGVADGKEGFAEFFEPFLKRNPVREVQIVRVIEDGSYVFTHSHQNLNNGESQWITADLFDTDKNDRVVEHWDSIQAYVSETKSGRTMFDGAIDIEDLDKTYENKAKIKDFCDVVLIGESYDRLEDFISIEQYHQHSPNVTDGIEGVRSYVKKLTESGKHMRFWKVHKLVGQGNFVVTLSHVQIGQSHYCVFDIYRLKNGLIVEHWDTQEKILAPEEWKNQGKF